jgi:hypothetical protein
LVLIFQLVTPQIPLACSLLFNGKDTKFIQQIKDIYKEENMQNKNSKGTLKSVVISAVKYVFATAMLGMIVLLVIATYVSAK